MQTLRAQYPVFRYDSFALTRTDQALSVECRYAIPPDFTFTHRVVFDHLAATASLDALTPFAFHIGLAEMFSYWKLTGAPHIAIQAGGLTPEQSAWWHGLLIQGMGEYFYHNQLDFTPPDFVTITAAGPTHAVSPPPSEATSRPTMLIPLGGGKDSIVTLELLKQQADVTPLIVYPTTPASRRIVAVAGLGDPLVVRRELDPALIALSKSGRYLNGHIPYSAALAFIFLLAAVAQRLPYIAVSNERSAEEGNATYLGRTINHQYSKTLAFERDFQAYIATFLQAPTRFFSFVRPLSELQIGKLFASMPQYWPVFRSCNRYQQQDAWCGACPKCVSVALSLLPWLPPGALERCMGSNPLSNPANTAVLDSMLQASQVKPFECIVSTEEAQVCLEFVRAGRTARVERYLQQWGDDSHVPTPFATLLRDAYARA